MAGLVGFIGLLLIGIAVVAFLSLNSDQGAASAREQQTGAISSKRTYLTASERERAFAAFISWAKREARAQRKKFNRLPGDNDYQRARQVFQDSEKWKKLRRSTLSRYPKCLRCGNWENLQVDHVIPMARRPDLFDIEDNLQTLCSDCNLWKMTRVVDYRRVDRSPSRRRTIPIYSGAPIISRYGDKPTQTQLQVKAALSLKPEERRQHEKRVAMLIVAERKVGKAMREAEKLGQYRKPRPDARRRQKQFSYLTEAPDR